MWQDFSDEVGQGDGDSVWSQTSQNKEFLEWRVLECFPLKWKVLSFWVQGVEPIFESTWCVRHHIVGEVHESWDLDKSLNHVPVVIWEPVLDWIGFTSLGDTVEEEVHIFLLKLNLDDFFLHETEGDQGQENELMGHEESSGDPLEDDVSDLLSEGKDSFFTFYSGLVHGFEEEVLERLKGELIHMR